MAIGSAARAVQEGITVFFSQLVSSPVGALMVKIFDENSQDVPCP